MDNHKHAKIFFIIASLFLIGLFYAGSGRVVWFDEAFSVIYSQHDISYIIQPHDVHPFGFYLLLHGYIQGNGVDLEKLRTFSLFFIIPAFLFILLALDEMFPGFYEDRGAYMYFMAILLFSTTIFHYFTEIRMYAMAMAFTAVSFYCMIRFVNEKGKNKWNGIFFVVFSALALYAHYYTALFFLMECSYIIWHFRWGVFKIMRAYAIGFCVLVAPLLVYFYFQRMRIVTMWFKDSDWFSMLSTYNYYFFHSFGESVPAINSWFGVLFIVLCFVLIGIGIGRSKGKEKKYMMWMLLFCIVPPFIGMIINLFVMKVYHHRFFIFAAWMFLFLVSYSIHKIKRNYVKAIICIFMLSIMIFNVHTYWTTFNPELIGAADKLKEVGCNEDIYVLHESVFSMFPSMYYNQVNNCTKLKEYVLTPESAYGFSIPNKMLNSVGFDAVNRTEVLFNNTDALQFADKGFYYFKHKGKIGNDTFDCKNIYSSDGLWLDKCQKKPVVISIRIN